MAPDLPTDVSKSLEQAEELMHAVEQALFAANLCIDELTVAADECGNAALFGLAPNADASQRADAIARSVPGVKLVRNTMLVR
jgi:hypothetical protein